MSDAASYHAIYLVLNDGDFFEASLKSVYSHITGATVVTSYDRDRWGNPVVPDRTIEKLLSREWDPEGKVNVLIASDGVEHVLRNRAMQFARGNGHATKDEPAAPDGLVPPDYFWIIDADEIYEDADVERMKTYVESHAAPAYRLTWRIYFRTWNWYFEEEPRFLAIVRPDFVFSGLRHGRRTLLQRVLFRLAQNRFVSDTTRFRLLGIRDIPGDVAVCHHGSYVGERERIAAKLESSGHRDEHVEGWMENVWDQWTPESRNLHPMRPDLYSQAHPISTDRLPPAIRNHEWPAGWLDAASDSRTRQ
jgi:hypothetical protein